MRRAHVPVLVFVAAVAVGLTALAPLTWLVLLTDGLYPLAVLAAAAGWGAWPAVWLGFRQRTIGQQLCIAIALGLGLLGVMTLVLGTGELLRRPLAWALLGTGGICGLTRLYAVAQRSAGTVGGADPKPTAAGPQQAESAARRPPMALKLFCALLLALPPVLALFGASLPPGILWKEEAGGYDVLEYHLQGPREWFDAGGIRFLPHNVYTSFPQQMEMLYLLLMHLVGDTHAAAIPAQLLHAACGVLAVVALACWTPPGPARCVVLLAAGTTPWLTHVGCLAYVENGMLFFAAIAAGLVLDHYGGAMQRGRRAALTAGLCAGLAGGCKYTALVLVSASLGLAWFLTAGGPVRHRTGRLAVFAFGTVLSFAPWLVRNAASTGNPVYPFAYEWFGGRAWSEEQARKWKEGHRVPAEHDSIVGRLRLAARELLGEVDRRERAAGASTGAMEPVVRPSLFGPALFVLALLGALSGRGGGSAPRAFLMLWVMLILIGWGGLTHMPGRFAMPLIVPLALLSTFALRNDAGDGAGAQTSRGERMRAARGMALALAFVGAGLNDVWLSYRLYTHARQWQARTDIPLRALIGRTDAFVAAHPLNAALPEGAYAWLIGDAAVFYVQRRVHYTVVFNRDPWLQFAESGAAPPECVEWLRARGVTHVAFAWGEIARLRRTYGFSATVTPAWVSQLADAGLHLTGPAGPPGEPAAVEVYAIAPPAAP